MDKNVQPQPPAVVPANNQQTVPAETLNEFDNFMVEQGLPPAADAGSSAQPAPVAQPSGASPAAAPSSEAAPSSAQSPAAESPGATPAVSAQPEAGAPAGAPAAPPEGVQASPPAQAAQPVAPAGAPLKGDEKFAVREGQELSRDQITFLLDAWNKGNTRDRAAADAYRKTFHMDPEQAEKEWGPIVSFLRENAEGGGRAPLVMQGVLDALFSGGRSAEDYLERALQTLSAHYQQHPPAQPAPQDRELRQRVENTERALQSQQLHAANQYVEREKSALIQQYSCLGDPQVWTMFASSALPVAQQQPGYTLSQHAQYNKRQLDLWQKAFEGGQPASQPAPATAQSAAAVPALVSSNGAAPAATRQPVNAGEEKRFDSLDDPAMVDEFLKAHPEPIQ